MRTTAGRTVAVAAAASMVTLGLAAPAVGGADTDLGREVLAEGDGWAAAGDGTTGGAAADDDHVFVVSTWQELRDALGGDDARGDTTDRIVYVDGLLDANTAPDGTAISCDDYADPAWDFDAYVADFEAHVASGEPPADWEAPEELEEARSQSNDNQDEQVRQFVGSNVTIVGLGDDAGITGGTLTVRDSQNVIIRNLTFSDSADCFPEWSPGDAGGTWNSEFDNVWVATSTNVWVDHNTFDGSDNPPESLPEVLGAKFEVYDGQLDITNGADLVTVSWNVFRDHDKMMLWGSTNNPRTPDDPQADRDRLRITLHHNLIEESGQRTPRVRFGQVHVYNNHYVQQDADLYQYSWGVGVESQIYAEDNYFDLGDDVSPADIVYDWGGTTITDRGSLVNGRSPAHRVDLVEVYNAEHEPDLAPVGWTPTLVAEKHPAQAVPGVVGARAGAGRIG